MLAEVSANTATATLELRNTRAGLVTATTSAQRHNVLTAKELRRELRRQFIIIHSSGRISRNKTHGRSKVIYTLLHFGKADAIERAPTYFLSHVALSVSNEKIL